MNRDWLTEFPDAKTPGQTLSRVLQGFRDPDGLEFLDLDGTYRILNLDKEAMASPAKSDPEQPYEARIYETTVQARSVTSDSGRLRASAISCTRPEISAATLADC